MESENLARILREDCRIDSEKPITLGFSGGPDSLALLHALHQIGIPVLVAHFDHGMRPESPQEAHQAGAVAASYGYSFFTQRADVASYARRNSMSLEEAARKLRYEFLFGIAADHDAQAVAVAHNADDQVETVLMHLLHGAGPGGLRGMPARLLPNPWSQTFPLIRPLLGFWRQEILDYCQTNGLLPMFDQSNLDTTFFRNRLRHELLPQLERISPGLKRRLHQTANLLAAESAIVHDLAENTWKRCLSLSGEDFIKLNRNAVQDEPLALQRLLFRRAAEMLRPGLRDLDYAAVENALYLLKRPMPSPRDWLAGLCLLVEGDHIWVADWEADLPFDWPQAPASVIHIELPAEVQLNHKWRLELRQDTEMRGAVSNADPFQAWLDSNHSGDELVLRRRRPGDRFQPLGMENGSLKLADYFINEKLPRRARDGWPLLCKGDEIVWVPGYQLAHAYRLTYESHRAMHVHLKRSNGRG